MPWADGDRLNSTNLNARFPSSLAFNVKDAAYGAVGDGATDDISAIQTACTAASTAGGGTVFVPKGTYLLGPSDGSAPASAGDYSIKLDDNVTLWLDDAAVLVRRFASTDKENATIRNDDMVNGNTNVVVRGGKIETQAVANTGMHICFSAVSGGRIESVWAVDAESAWNVYLRDCTDISVIGLRVTESDETTEDGLHIGGGSRIVVTGCDIRAGDDAIGIVQESSFATTDTTDVVIANCHLESATASALKLDCKDNMTPSNRAIRRVAVNNCTMKSGGSGVVIRDQNHLYLVSDVVVNGVVMDGSSLTGELPLAVGVARVQVSDFLLRQPLSFIQADWATDVVFRNISVSSVRSTTQPAFKMGTSGANTRLMLDGVVCTDAHIRVENTTDLTLQSCSVVSVQAALTPALSIGSSNACANVRILGGVYKGATGDGILLGTTGTVTDALVQGAYVSTSAWNGIAVAKAIGCVVEGCRILSATSSGVEVLSGCQAVSLIGNDVRGNTTSAISDAGTGTFRKGNRTNSATGKIAGRAVLSSGNTTVATGEALSGDNIILSRVVSGGTHGILSVATIVASMSFQIDSTQTTDTSTIYYEIVH